MFVSVNRRYNEAPARIAMWARASLFRRFTHTNAYTEPPVPLKCAKHAAKYPWIYGYVYSVVGSTIDKRSRTISASVRRGRRATSSLLDP